MTYLSCYLVYESSVWFYELIIQVRGFTYNLMVACIETYCSFLLADLVQRFAVIIFVSMAHSWLKYS